MREIVLSGKIISANPFLKYEVRVRHDGRCKHADIVDDFYTLVPAQTSIWHEEILNE